MKKCPKCKRTYPDEKLNFCLDDGTTLILESDDFETEVLTPQKTEVLTRQKTEVPTPQKRKLWKIVVPLVALAVLFVFALIAAVGIFQFRNEIASLFNSEPKVTKPTPEISTELTDEQQILNLFKTLRKAYVEDDYDELDKIMADEYVEVNSFGQRLTKKQILSPVQVGEKISLEHSDLEVNVNGKRATVTGKGIQRGKFSGVEVSVRFTFKTNLKKQDGRWQATYSDIKIRT